MRTSAAAIASVGLTAGLGRSASAADSGGTELPENGVVLFHGASNRCRPIVPSMPSIQWEVSALIGFAKHFHPIGATQRLNE